MLKNRSWPLDILFLILFLGSLFFILTGVRPLWVPDEGRYAEIAREMALSGNYLTPYLNGIRYFEKPPLFYWLSAASLTLFGNSLWSLRSISALMALITCLATYATGYRLYDRATGLLAALVLGTSTLFFLMAHVINLDMTVTTCLTFSFYGILLGSEATHPRFYFWGASVAAALGLLCKGLMAITFPILVVGTWIILLNNWRLLKHMYIFSSLLIFLMIALPWHLLLNAKHPEFLHFYFIEQQLMRYATDKIGHNEPIWFFVPVLIAGLFPWIVFLPQACLNALPSSWTRRNAQRIPLFLLLWASIIFAFFSFSHSKLIPYILSIFPPLALLIAAYLTKKFQHSTWGIKLSFGVLIIFALIISKLIFSHLNTASLPDVVQAKRYLYPAIAMLVVGTILSAAFVQHLKRALTLLIATMWIFLLLLLASIPATDSRTILPLAKLLKTKLKPNDLVVTYNQYYQDLAFYIERRVIILNWRNELSFGAKHQTGIDWLWNNDIFWRHWHSKQRLFVILSEEELHQLIRKNPYLKIYILGKTPRVFLISNQPDA